MVRRLHNSGSIAAALLVCAVAVGDEPAVVIDDSLSISGAAGRQMPLRVVFPPAGDALPVVILSHGTFSSGKKYDPVATHWAANGFAVILPDHRDANYGETPTSEAHMLEIIESRGQDLVVIADQLEDIEARIPGLAGRLDPGRLASAGHSVGTSLALQLTGLRFRNPKTDRISAIDEDRFAATVLLSDPGKMALMPADLWLAGARPVLMVTGPDDYGMMGDGRRATEYENEILPAKLPGEGEHYLLSITGLDHQFGGLIHRDVEAEPDTEAMEVFLELSTAFLAVYLRGDGSAAKMLESRRLSDRAELTVD